MPFSPCVSVVVPVYNGERFLAETLRSIQEQTFEDWECIVVDDGSSDASVTIAEKFRKDDARFRLIRQENAGVSAARNRGMAERNAEAHYLLFMDQDDLGQPFLLDALVDVLRVDHKALASHGLSDLIDEHGKSLGNGVYAASMRRRLGFDGRSIVDWRSSDPTTFANSVWFNPVCPPGVLLVRCDVAASIGGWNPCFRGAQDWDFVIRLSRLTPILFVDRVVCLYRRHSGNVSNDSALNKREIRLLYHKTFFSSENTDDERAMLRGGWRACQVFKMGESLSVARNDLRRGRLQTAVPALARIPVYILRYLRGYPSMSGW